MTTTTVYAYASCDTCRRALAWLRAHHVEPRVVPIVDQPPTAAELRGLIARAGLPIRKWLNTSGQSYRALVAERGKEAIAALTDDAIVALLAADGKLIKRPVVVHGEQILVGFDEATYGRVFAGTR